MFLLDWTQDAPCGQNEYYKNKHKLFFFNLFPQIVKFFLKILPIILFYFGEFFFFSMWKCVK